MASSYFYMPDSEFRPDTPFPERALVAHIHTGGWRIEAPDPKTAAALAKRFQPWNPDQHGRVDLTRAELNAITKAFLAEGRAES